jgi:hypothetical protein
MTADTSPTPVPRRHARATSPHAEVASRRRRHIGWLLLAIACAAGIAIVIANIVGTEAPSEQLFAADSVWNAPLSPHAPLDPKSSTYVAELEQQLAHYGPWLNTTHYSVPVYTVGSGQPTVRVRLDPAASSPALREAWRAVPLPENAKPASGNDGELVVWQPSTNRMWEFWQLQRDGTGWHARWGGYMASVQTNPGYYVGHTDWGATATSLPAIAGLVRISELKSGHIDHALSVALPETSSEVYSWPAERTDGNVASPDAIPEGTRFRLDPSLDISKLHLPSFIRMLAEAAQRYGVIVHDRGGAVTMFGEDPNPYDNDPYLGPHGFFQNKSLIKLMWQFPWAHLEALRTLLHRVGK